jgi:prepilin-type N-terminal cleavage/methylation domain-containing protein
MAGEALHGTRVRGAGVRPRAAAGYTAVEVLIAMTVMAVGAAAVMTMQKASIQGNLDARKLDVANNIARMWEERLQADAMAWTQPNANAATTTNIASGALVADGLGNHPGTWFLPADYAGNTPPESYVFDILGRDLQVGNIGSAIYCVAIRLTPLVPGNLPTSPALVRADVRVLWLRGLGATTPSGTTFCSAGGAAGNGDALAPDPSLYQALYVTTALRENPAQ